MFKPWISFYRNCLLKVFLTWLVHYLTNFPTEAEVSLLVQPKLNTSVPYRDCGSPFAYVTRLEVFPPCQKNLCIFKRGEDALMIADFVPRTTNKELKLNVYNQDWYLNVDTILWHNKAVCGKWNVSCPVDAYTTQYSYFHVRLPKELPQIKLILKLVLIGDNDVQLLCHSAPVEVQ